MMQRSVDRTNDDIEGLEGAAVKTYRYLRIAMVVIVFVLAASVVIEWVRAPGSCLQTSISAYYFTPARAVFVGALVAIGTCLVAVKGSTPREDVSLNLAGMLAPVVAFVPTTEPDGCFSSPLLSQDPGPSISNNVLALLLGGLAALLATVVIAFKERARLAHQPALDDNSKGGIAIAAALVAGGTAWFAFGRSSFDEHAHNTSAILMFVFIGIAVALNATAERAGREVTPRYAKLYWAIAAGMAAAAVILVVAKFVFDFEHAVFVLEAVEITLFATFWAAQTAELWTDGVRPTSTS